MTIVADAITTPGAIWERDVSDCGGGTRNETEVPIDPEKEWLMYSCPPGTTPISGEGLTATFTTTHGGQVVVQFKARAAVATPNPPYDQQVSGLTNPFRVFEVISLEPDFGLLAVDNDADPNTKLYVVSPPRPAPGIITVRATPNPLVSAGELPECWTLSGSSGVTIVDKLTATLNGSVPGTYEVNCQAGTSYRKATIVVVRLLPVEFKRNDEPASFFSVEGGGDVVLNESFNWRMLVEGETDAIEHILKWEVRAPPNNSQIALGDGLAFTRAMAPLGLNIVQFWIDLNDDNLATGVEPKKQNDHADVVNLVNIPLVIKRHTAVAFSNSDADTLLANATTLLRKRDQLDDLRCGVRLLRSGTVTTFASPQSIASETMLNQAFSIPGNVKIVQSFTYPGADILGMCIRYTTNIVIKASATASAWAHEVGHAQGMGDVSSPNHRIMHSAYVSGMNTLNDYQRIRYRSGPP